MNTIRSAVQYANTRGRQVLKTFATAQAAKRYFDCLDALGKVAQLGEYVSDPLPMLLVDKESKAYVKQRNEQYAAVAARKAARKQRNDGS